MKSNKIKKSLIATLADENYIDQAKQLFSSVYSNAAWQGDYLLLSHNIPKEKLGWFKDRGILIYECRPVVKEKKYGNSDSIMLDKIYLFNKYFKKWQNIIYLDSDIIVKSSLDGLLNEKNFSAVQDLKKLKDQIVSLNKIKSSDLKKIFMEIKSKYSLESPVFNAGFFVFNTDIITDDSFNNLNFLTDKYKNISINGDQLIFNFFFYNKWNHLPCVYNFFPYLATHPVIFTNTKIEAIVLHFAGKRKPWLTFDPFYKQWKDNLNKAEKINFQNPLPKAKAWSEDKIKKNSRTLKIKKTLYVPILYLDKFIGLIGILIRKNFA